MLLSELKVHSKIAKWELIENRELTDEEKKGLLRVMIVEAKYSPMLEFYYLDGTRKCIGLDYMTINRLGSSLISEFFIGMIVKSLDRVRIVTLRNSSGDIIEKARIRPV